MKKTFSKLLLTIFSTVSLISISACGKRYFTVTFDSQGGTEVETQIVKKGELVTKPEDPIKTGFAFKRWVDVDTRKQWSFDSPVTKDINLSARYDRCSYDVTVDYDNSLFMVEGTGNYDFEKDVTLKVYLNKGLSFKGWKDLDNDVIISTSQEYSFKMPGNNLHLTILSEIQSNSYVQLGTYPQGLVSNQNLVNTLNDIIGHTPDKNTDGWIDYHYYDHGVDSPIQFYTDIEYGNAKYRGVYKIKQRSWYTSYEANEVPEYARKIEWYKFSPLMWRIAENKNNEKLLVCATAIDGTHYSLSYNGICWETSNIRSFLNDTFYNLSFTQQEKNLLINTGLTNDKVCIFSKDELMNPNYGFDFENRTSYSYQDNNYKVKPSDYACAQLLDSNGRRFGESCASWMLRDLESTSFSIFSWDINDFTTYPYNTVYMGIMPVIKIGV